MIGVLEQRRLSTSNTMWSTEQKRQVYCLSLHTDKYALRNDFCSIEGKVIHRLSMSPKRTALIPNEPIGKVPT